MKDEDKLQEYLDEVALRQDWKRYFRGPGPRRGANLTPLLPSEDSKWWNLYGWAFVIFMAGGLMWVFVAIARTLWRMR